MKAFVITIDALMAISFLFLAVLLLATQTFQPTAPRGIYLKQLTLDVLTVLDKTKGLDYAVEGNTNPMNMILASTPESACMQISIIDYRGEQVAVIGKVGCGEYGRELQTASTPFVHDGRVYTAKADAWYRKEST